jgi:catechol 2,3-dioxygenase-like lactoylglutathione lyase family enzyme
MVDMHLEVDVIPVSDVERSKQFYGRLGWRLDDDGPWVSKPVIVGHAESLLADARRGATNSLRTGAGWPTPGRASSPGRIKRWTALSCLDGAC